MSQVTKIGLYFVSLFLITIDSHRLNDSETFRSVLLHLSRVNLSVVRDKLNFTLDVVYEVLILESWKRSSKESGTRPVCKPLMTP